jgi:glycosyltransferase involved in cell wall biosynthesis
MTTPGLVSVIIPARNEIFLSKTIQDVLAKATGSIEVIAVLDGYWPVDVAREHWSTPAIIDDTRVTYLHTSVSQGMRDSINAAAALARGQYLLKVDAHVMFAPGYDEVLKKDIEDNWIVIPRRNRLDAELWEVQDVGKPPVDYEFLSSPADAGVKGNIWTQRALDRADKPEYMVDENMTFQGSCWFMTRKHYWDFLGGMSTVGYGTFVREAQEIGLKTWLGGGKVMTNKNVWYAHLHKGPRYGRMYHLDAERIKQGNAYTDDFWFNNRWDGAIHDLAWLVERFWPVPTWTPELVEQVRKK